MTGSLRAEPSAEEKPVQVRLSKGDRVRLVSVQTASARDGQYAFQDVQPGVYTVTAAIQDSVQVFKPLFGAARQVTVGERDTYLDLDLQLLPDVTGTVIFDDGCTPTPGQVTVGGAQV